VTGIYGTWSFRNSPSWLKSTWFHHKGGQQYEIISEIREMVAFTCLSLVEMSAIGNFNTMDIIFCRNVLMYFTPKLIKKISNSFFNALIEEGWFVVSSCELSSHVFPQFTPVNFPGAVMYRKTKKEYIHSSNVYPDEIPEATSVSVASAETDIQPSSTFFNPLKLLSSVASLTTEAFAKVVTKEDLQPFNYSTIQRPQTIPKETSADRIFAIRLLANVGHLEEALLVCNEAIASYKLAPGLYFLRASILQELDKGSEAIASLKQAIYINPDYIMGHFTLGNLFIRQGNTRNAKRYFNNALDLLGKRANDDILPESEGLSVKYIREIIIANMQTQLTK
jgi:chemotaxis protein methyltransferase CheR